MTNAADAGNLLRQSTMSLYRTLAILPFLVVHLTACGPGDPPPPAPLAQKPGCRAVLTGTMARVALPIPAPQVTRGNGPPVTGEWSDPPTSRTYVVTSAVDVPCGANSTLIEFPELRGVARLPPQIRVDVPGGPYFLFPTAADFDDPTAGPAFPIQTQSSYQASIYAADGAPDICQSTQTTFPIGAISRPGQASGPPPTGYEALEMDTTWEWTPATDWKDPEVPFELEDASVVLVCDSRWSFVGGYQLTYENEIEGIVQAKAVHDFWIDSELALLDDGETIQGYYRVYDIKVEPSANVSGAYSGPSEIFIPVTGFFEKDVDGKQFLDLPWFRGAGVTWTFTLDVLGSKTSQSNPGILQDHFDRLNATLPLSPTRADTFRVAAVGQEDTTSYWADEGFVITNWALHRLEPPK